MTKFIRFLLNFSSCGLLQRCIAFIVLMSLLSISPLVTAASNEAGTSAIVPEAKESLENKLIQTVNKKMEKNIQENKKLQDKVDSLVKNLILMTQEVFIMRELISQIQQQGSMAKKDKAVDLHDIIYLIGYAVLTLIFIGTILLLYRQKQRPAPTSAIILPNEEYDFLGSSEGIPAKLDLARAYIAMEDYLAARDTLLEVFAKGNAQQREEAKDLLTKIIK